MIDLQKMLDDAYESATAGLRQEIASQKEVIEAQDELLAARAAEIIILNDGLDERDEEILKLKTRIAELEAGQPEPEPEEPEEPAPEPGGFRWPDASNTGVPAGTVLTAYSGPAVVTKDGTVIESKIFSGYFEVRAANVTIRRCKFTGGADWAINGDLARDMVIEDNEFSGMTKAILAQGLIQRNNFHGTTIAITLKDGQSTVRRNFIHDLSANHDNPHFDGVFIAGGQRDCLIEENWIEVPTAGGTASIFIATRWQNSHIVNTTVRRNRLLGTPSFALYVDDTSVANVSGTVIEDNEVQRGAYGYFSINDMPDVTLSGNVDAFTGASIN